MPLMGKNNLIYRYKNATTTYTVTGENQKALFIRAMCNNSSNLIICMSVVVPQANENVSLNTTALISSTSTITSMVVNKKTPFLETCSSSIYLFLSPLVSTPPFQPSPLLHDRSRQQTY